MRGSLFQIRAIFTAQYRICVHTLDCHLRAAKNNKQGEVVRVENWNQRKWGYPGLDLGFWRVLMTVF